MVNSELETYRKDALEAAKDLMYSETTICKIEHAETITRICNAMYQARIDGDICLVSPTRNKNNVFNERN